jgi:hypothetical protein
LLRAPTLTLAAVILVTACVLGGCGGGSTPLRRVVDAANSTRALSGTSYDLALQGQRLTAPPTDLPGGTAAYDLAAGIGYEALTVNRPGGGKRTIFLDFVPGAVLVAPWPTPPGLLPPGKTWISVGFTGPGAPRPGDALPAQLEGLSPELALDEIAWGARAASSLGTRTVNHVPMQEYRVEVDLAKALAAARKRRREAVAAAIAGELRAVPSARASVEVWVTGPGHVGKITKAVPGTGLGRATFSFTSFDAQFKRNRPRAAQTVALASIAKPSSHALWVIATSS